MSWVANEGAQGIESIYVDEILGSFFSVWSVYPYY